MPIAKDQSSMIENAGTSPQPVFVSSCFWNKAFPSQLKDGRRGRVTNPDWHEAWLGSLSGRCWQPWYTIPARRNFSRESLLPPTTLVRHLPTANNSVQDPQWHSALPQPVVFKVGHERLTPHCPMGLRAFWSRACKTRPSDLGHRCAELCTFLLPAERMHKSCATRICLTVDSSSSDGKRLSTLNRSQP